MYDAYKKILIQYSALNTFQLHYLTIVVNFYLHWKCVTKYYRPVKSQYKPRKSKYGTRELVISHEFNKTEVIFMTVNSASEFYRHFHARSVDTVYLY